MIVIIMWRMSPPEAMHERTIESPRKAYRTPLGALYRQFQTTPESHDEAFQV